MRERRWESTAALTFDEVLVCTQRLAGYGVKTVVPSQEILVYLEEWAIDTLEDRERLDRWYTEDGTVVQSRDGWHGDFFLLVGALHTVYARHRGVGAYCSVSHPWRSEATLDMHEPLAMLWVGFREIHGFLRVRLQTKRIVLPGEDWLHEPAEIWLNERRQLVEQVLRMLEWPVEVAIEDGRLQTQAKDGSAMFCSWPDAFGPCQIESTCSDPYLLFVPAARLAATVPEPLTVRTYLTGFGESALAEFAAVQPAVRLAYRCSAHCSFDELPDMLGVVGPTGRLYATVCEFQTQSVLPSAPEASAIVGVVGQDDHFQIEVRLNRAPLPLEKTQERLEGLLGMPLQYAPLPAFV